MEYCPKCNQELNEEMNYCPICGEPITDLAKQRELLKIQNAYPKMIIARTRHDDYQYEGVQIVDITNWLSE